MGLDLDLLEAVQAAIRQSVTSYLRGRPREVLAGFALLTDDGLETLLSMAITQEALADSSDPDVLFTATDWPDEVGQVELDPVDRRLRELQKVREFELHVENSFATLVEALAALRREGVFSPSTYLDVLSTDPGERLLVLQSSAIQQLNDKSMIDARTRFIAKWSREEG